MTQPVRERRIDGAVPLFVHEEWAARFPFLVQGTTAGGADDADLGLFRDAPVGAVMERWRRLRTATGSATAVHARQVHGARVLAHGPLPAGLVIGEDADGHATREPGLLLTISVADCVPVTLVCPEPRAVAMLHAGWRGAAAGVLEAGIAALQAYGVGAGSLWVHLGPAICGRCYEVGPEVFAALGVAPVPADRRLDLRSVLAARAAAAGVPAAQISSSAWCTRCDAGAFFSHRGGSSGRQLGIAALRP